MNELDGLKKSYTILKARKAELEKENEQLRADKKALIEGIKVLKLGLINDNCFYIGTVFYSILGEDRAAKVKTMMDIAEEEK